MHNMMFSDEINYDSSLFLCEELSLLLTTGTTLETALKELSQRSPASLKDILTKVYIKVASGTSFSSALEAFPEYFSTGFISLINAGEKTGNLSKELDKISIEIKRAKEIESKLKHALILPKFIIIFVYFVTFIFFLY